MEAPLDYSDNGVSSFVWCIITASLRSPLAKVKLENLLNLSSHSIVDHVCVAKSSSLHCQAAITDGTQTDTDPPAYFSCSPACVVSLCCRHVPGLSVTTTESSITDFAVDDRCCGNTGNGSVEHEQYAQEASVQDEQAQASKATQVATTQEQVTSNTMIG
jgi:hypothetical protein